VGRGLVEKIGHVKGLVLLSYPSKISRATGFVQRSKLGMKGGTAVDGAMVQCVTRVIPPFYLNRCTDGREGGGSGGNLGDVFVENVAVRFPWLECQFRVYVRVFYVRFEAVTIVSFLILILLPFFRIIQR